MGKNSYRSVKKSRKRRRHDNIYKSSKETIRIKKYNSIKKIVKERKFTKALGEIEDYLYEYPNEPYGLSLYATILMALRRNKEAEEQLETIINNNAVNKYSAMYILGNLEKRMGNIEKAEIIYKRVINESEHEEGLSRIALAQIYKENYEYDKAKELLLSIKEESKDYAYLELSKISLDESDTVAAFDYISQVKRSENEAFNRNISIQKGVIEETFNNYKLAKEYFEEALNGPKDNNYLTARLKLMELEIDFENYEQALFLCNDMIQKGELINGETYLALGQIYTKIGYFNKAREYFEKAKEGQSENKINGKIAYNIGMLNFKEKNYDEGISNFIKSSHTRKYRKGSLINLIYINIRKKDYKNAKYYMDKVIKESILKNDNEELIKIKALINKSINKPIKLEKSYSYSVGQYISYDEKEAYKHIENNHYGDDYDRSAFNPDVNLEELILDVKTKLVPDNIEVQGLADCYYIDMDNIGVTKEGEICNKVKVVVVPNTKDIITMFPVTDKFNKKEKEKPKIKKKSRIDLFNERYNLN